MCGCAYCDSEHAQEPDGVPEPMSVTVTKAENGYIIECADALTLCEISETADALGHCNGTVAMLYAVLEAFGEVGTKHDSHRVRVHAEARRP